MKKAIKFIFFTILLISTTYLKSQPTVFAAQSQVGNATSATITKPSGVTASDLLVIGVTFEKGSSETVTPPAGWTLILRTNNGTDCGMATYYKVATASEPSTYSFGLSNGSKWGIGISRITGAGNASPIDATGSSTGSGGNPVAPSITTTGPNRLILCFYTNKKAAVYTPDASTNEYYDFPYISGGVPSNMMAIFTKPTAGATGNKTATPSETERWATQQIAIRPTSPLPIELITFSAYGENNNKVTCKWSTATEKNNHHFNVERSQDGINFEDVGSIDGAGNSSVLKNYNYCDNQPLNGISYYRLKQVDYDGNFSYSDLVSVDIYGLNIITLYPNPAEDKISLHIMSPTDLPAQINIYTLQGQRLASFAEHIYKGQSTLPINIANLNSGAYIIRLVAGSDTHIEKGFIKR